MADKVIIIIGDSFTFPDGNAATNRVYTYAKGLHENEIDVHVICFRNDYLEASTGEADGIKYYYPFDQSVRSPFFIVRRWHSLRKYINTFRSVRNINILSDIQAFIVYTPLFTTYKFVWFLAKIFKAKLLLERSEHPLKDYKNRISRIVGHIRLFLIIRLSDGILCISDYLRKYYASMGARDEKVLIVSSTVDFNRFQGDFKSPFDFRYICYCGSLTLLKDGVHILIESFLRIESKHPEVFLVLIGKADYQEEEDYFRSLASKLGGKRRIIFTGVLSRNVIPEYLCNADVLTLARPRSMVADAGFPSKVTEYLATGKPIVVTRVGEIPIYLTDKTNVFLAEPDSVDDFAEKLDYVLSNYESALIVGNNGRELASTVFSYNYQAKRIIEFIRRL